jgi:hypothetical protein
MRIDVMLQHPHPKFNLHPFTNRYHLPISSAERFEYYLLTDPVPTFTICKCVRTANHRGYQFILSKAMLSDNGKTEKGKVFPNFCA